MSMVPSGLPLVFARDGSFGPGSEVNITNCGFEGFTNGTIVIESFESDGTTDSLFLAAASVFANNTGTESAGAIDIGDAVRATVMIEDTEFRNNTGGGSAGGAVSILGDTGNEGPSVTIMASNFFNNTAATGGAVAVSTVNGTVQVIASQFESNTASSSDAGALFVTGGVPFGPRVVNLTSGDPNTRSTPTCRFVDNKNNNFGGGAVSLIRVTESVTVDGCIFERNTANNNGGGLRVSSETTGPSSNVNVSIVSSQFLNNEASTATGGGVDLSTVNVLTVNSSTFQGNSAATNGGGVRVLTAQEVQLEDNLFVGNRASQGGGIFAGTADMIISSSDTYTDNDVTSGNGGAVNIDGGDFALFLNGRFLRNTAAAKGGALRFSGIAPQGTQSVTISDCEFRNNSATSGAATNGGSVSIETTGLFLLESSTFTDNFSTNGGAVDVSSATNTTITGSLFERNSGQDAQNTGLGGAVQATLFVTLDVIASNFTENSAPRGGGAFYVEVQSRDPITNVTFSQCLFQNNSLSVGSGLGGAGVFVQGVPGTNVVIEDSNFDANDAVDDTGGAVATNEVNAVFVRRSRFTDNSATNEGGALSLVSVDNTVRVVESTFDSNEGSLGGAVRVRSSPTGDLELLRSDFLDNRSNSTGGAVALSDLLDVAVTDASFRNNTSVSNGGGLFAESISGDFSVTTSLFVTNTARDVNDEVDGGAMYTQFATTVNLRSSNFTSNAVSDDGGAATIDDNLGDVLITNCNFTTNTATDEGGALKIVFDSADPKSLDVVDSIFTSNSVDEGKGGAMILDDALSATLLRSTFVSNSAQDDGGAITLDNVVNAVTIESCTFDSNSSPEKGGAVDYDASSSALTAQIIVRESRFANNTSSSADAGGLYVRDAVVANIISTEFFGNTAFDDGGAIVIDKVGTLATISNCNFTSNEAGASGGGLFVEDSNLASLIVQNSNFTENFISDPPTGTPNDFDEPGDGGGAFITGIGGPSAALTFSSCNFRGNTAPDDGGGLVITGVSDGSLLNPGSITLTDNLFEENVAGASMFYHSFPSPVHLLPHRSFGRNSCPYNAH